MLLGCPAVLWELLHTLHPSFTNTRAPLPAPAAHKQRPKLPLLSSRCSPYVQMQPLCT
jgi:hypothetical protein